MAASAGSTSGRGIGVVGENSATPSDAVIPAEVSERNGARCALAQTFAEDHRVLTGCLSSAT
jgi:hypothetical protein